MGGLQIGKDIVIWGAFGTNKEFITEILLGIVLLCSKIQILMFSLRLKLTKKGNIK